jgi:hypothetical protein
LSSSRFSTIVNAFTARLSTSALPSANPGSITARRLRSDRIIKVFVKAGQPQLEATLYRSRE